MIYDKVSSLCVHGVHMAFHVIKKSTPYFFLMRPAPEIDDHLLCALGVMIGEKLLSRRGICKEDPL